MSKHEAAHQQIEAAIEAFHRGQFAVAITLAGAAEDMTSAKSGGLWERMLDHPNRPIMDEKVWKQHLNATRNWLKHDKDAPSRNLVSFEVGLFILRAMDKWEPWSPTMLEFRELFFSSPKLIHPDEYDRS